MDNSPLLEVKNLSFSYDGRNAVLRDIGFRVEPGEVFVILGANGAGKSTLLNCIGGVLSPTGGEVLLMGRRVGSYSAGERARIVGYVPQISAPAFSYTVRDYVVMGRAPYMGLLNVPGDAEYEMADRALERMGIGHLADKLCNGISGGERQQAQITRVLVQEPRLILLDEPTNHLDYGNQLKIVKTVSQLAAEGFAVVMTTHMPDHAILLNGSAGLMGSDGRMTSGPAGSVISEAALRELYHTNLHLVYVDPLERMACVAGKL